MAANAVSVPATGEPGILTIGVANTSTIVDGYQVAPASIPGWLAVEAEQPRLLPGTEGTLTIRLRASAPTLVLAQQLRVMLIVRSLSQAPAYAELPVEITVPAIETPVRLRAEPRLLRLRDGAPGEFTVFADNPSNRTARLNLTGSDPEVAVRFSFVPEVLQVGPGATGSVRVTAVAPGPAAGEEISRQLTVTAADGPRTAEVGVTMQQGRSVSVMSTLGLRVEPSLIRVRDVDGADVSVVLDNRRGANGVRLSLEGRDPEQAMRLTFSPAVVDVPPSQIQTVRLRLDSWRPQPGTELTRTFTVVASDGRDTKETTGSLVQSASRAAIEVLGVRTDPNVLRLANRSRGTVTASVDNRNGAQPVRVWLKGDDPENAVRFTFAPQVLDVPAGQVGQSIVTLEAARPPARQQVTRAFTVIASDGRNDVSTGGTLIQTSGDRRPVARALWTLFGALAMMVGSFQSWLASGGLRGVDLTAPTFGIDRSIGGLENVLSLGLGMVGLGLLAVLGLIGAKGRLTRFAAVVGLLGLIGLFVFVGIRFGGDLPGGGAILCALGCIAAYIGGRLIRR